MREEKGIAACVDYCCRSAEGYMYSRYVVPLVLSVACY